MPFSSAMPKKFFSLPPRTLKERISFNKIASSNCVGCTEAKASLYKNLLHADFRDFHMSPDGGAFWVAGDGGIAQNSFTGYGWVSRNYRLHTYHIHSVVLLPGSQNGAVDASLQVMTITLGIKRSQLAGNANWQQMPYGCMGDANWVAGDPGSPGFAVVVRHSNVRPS